jgi:putative serine protease PepD
MSSPEPTRKSRRSEQTSGSGRPWYRSDRVALGALLAALLVVAVVAVVAIVGWHNKGKTTATSCDPSAVAEKTMASVVTILVRSPTGQGSNGSGEFLDTKGDILTNNHVISSSVGGGTITVLRPNGETLPATLVGRDNATDLAVISVTPKSTVVPITFGQPPRVGEQVFAIGAPMGLSDTFTAGVVSALGRSTRVPADHGTTALITSAIQTDASINPGNSGGTLADCKGELVGVPTAGATANDSAGGAVGGSIGLGFAIPADFAHQIATRLIADGKVTHSDLGVSVVPTASGENAIAPDGLYLSAVNVGGPADQAGLRQGDIITALDGAAITSADQLQALTLTKQPGEVVKVEYSRAGAKQTVDVTLGASAL